MEPEVVAIWTPLLSAVISGLVVLGVSVVYQRRRERRKEKLAILGTLMANRHGLTANGNEDAKARFFQALNSAFVPFHRSRRVVVALNELKRNQGQTGSNVTRLLRAMMEDLRIDMRNLDDSFFDEPYTPGKT